MKITLILVTRNKSIMVKTLHTILKYNLFCLKNNHTTNIVFVNDDPVQINSCIVKSLKNSDRVVFIDYSICIDEQSIDLMLNNEWPQGYHGIVFPCVKEGVNWDMFRKKVKDGCDEPYSQMGLEFDTDVKTKMKDGFWTIDSTCPKVWALNSKSVIKTLREKKGDGIKLPYNRQEMFSKLKICAFTKAKVTATYTHECLGNILETAGITRQG